MSARVTWPKAAVSASRSGLVSYFGRNQGDSSDRHPPLGLRDASEFQVQLPQFSTGLARGQAEGDDRSGTGPAEAVEVIGQLAPEVMFDPFDEGGCCKTEIAATVDAENLQHTSKLGPLVQRLGHVVTLEVTFRN